MKEVAKFFFWAKILAKKGEWARKLSGAKKSLTISDYGSLLGLSFY
jgi:hypothetical protein